MIAKCKTSYREFVGNRLRIDCESGNLHMEPAFSYGGLMLGVQHGGQPPYRFTPKPADQFATEIDDFSQCILEGKPTRTPGEEGWRDMKIIEALYQSASEKKAIKM